LVRRYNLNCNQRHKNLCTEFLHFCLSVHKCNISQGKLLYSCQRRCIRKTTKIRLTRLSNDTSRAGRPFYIDIFHNFLLVFIFFSSTLPTKRPLFKNSINLQQTDDYISKINQWYMIGIPCQLKKDELVCKMNWCVRCCM